MDAVLFAQECLEETHTSPSRTADLCNRRNLFLATLSHGRSRAFKPGLTSPGALTLKPHEEMQECQAVIAISCPVIQTTNFLLHMRCIIDGIAGKSRAVTDAVSAYSRDFSLQSARSCLRQDLESKMLGMDA